MIDEKQAKLICCENISNIYGYAEAVADKTQTWDLHHCIGLAYSKQELIDMGLYYNQPAEYLMFVTRKQHKHLHHKFMREDEHIKRSNAVKGAKNPNYGVKYSPERLKQMSKAMKGFRHTEESKRKISEGHKGIDHSYCNKKVYQYTKNGKFIAVYNSISEASVATGVDKAHISACCNGKKHYKTAGGYVWSFSI